MNVYQENGHDSRRDYLQCLAEDYGINLETVIEGARLLVPEEDFDALVTWCEDASELVDRDGWQ